VTFRPAALTAVRAVRHGLSGRNASQTTRTAPGPAARTIADQRRAIQTARAESGPVRRTGPGTRTTLRTARSAAG
jgi:hypothetical protein